MVIVASAALISTSAFADPSRPAKKPVDPGQKIVCKTQEFVGSLIPRRLWKAKAHWDERAIDAKAALDQHHLSDDPKKLCGC